jgi:hypothetical protein
MKHWFKKRVVTNFSPELANNGELMLRGIWKHYFAELPVWRFGELWIISTLGIFATASVLFLFLPSRALLGFTQKVHFPHCTLLHDS